METCKQIDPLTTRFVDDEASAAERGLVARHLSECPPCRRSVQAEQQAREAVRAHAEALIGSAPVGLRARCAAARAPAGPRAWAKVPLLSRARWPMAMAATLVLALAGGALYGLALHPSEAIAAQLTLDHLKCFVLFEEPAGLVPAEVQAALKARHGIDIFVPAGARSDGLTLVGGRRCLYLDGSILHLMYRRGAVPVSLFVLPPGAKLSHTELDVLGHTALAFERAGRTCVVLARIPQDDIRRIAAAFGRAAE